MLIVIVLLIKNVYTEAYLKHCQTFNSILDVGQDSEYATGIFILLPQIKQDRTLFSFQLALAGFGIGNFCLYFVKESLLSRMIVTKV